MRAAEAEAKRRRREDPTARAAEAEAHRRLRAESEAWCKNTLGDGTARRERFAERAGLSSRSAECREMARRTQDHGITTGPRQTAGSDRVLTLLFLVAAVVFVLVFETVFVAKCLCTAEEWASALCPFATVATNLVMKSTRFSRRQPTKNGFRHGGGRYHEKTACCKGLIVCAKDTLLLILS